jgi:hypothetical protein
VCFKSYGAANLGGFRRFLCLEQCDAILNEGVVEHAAHVSITHLTFDRRLPLAREIATYQKHRSKRLRRANAGRAPARFR